MKKILVVGYFSDNPNVYTYARTFYNKLTELKFITKKFNYCLSIVPVNKLNNLLINFFLILKVIKFKPNIIFFIKAENIYSKTLKFIKKYSEHTCLKAGKFTGDICSSQDQPTENITLQGPILINFYPDNPFVFWNNNSNKNILLSLPIYNFFLIWAESLIPVLNAAGAQKVYYFPFAYDNTIFSKELLLKAQKDKTYLSDVCFIGTWDPEREYFLSYIHEQLPSITLAIWGNHWKKNISNNSNLIGCLRGDAIYHDKIIKAFRNSKIILNFIRKQNIDAHNMRTLEVPACGIFLLTQRTKDQAEKLFKEGESIECFSTPQELKEKIVFYLAHDNKRDIIANKSFTQAQKFNFNIIIKKFLEENKLL
jgi:hypothetical protein